MSIRAVMYEIPGFALLNRLRRHLQALRFNLQGTIDFPIGKFNLKLPSRHPLPATMAKQPYRDIAISMTAKVMGAKYPNLPSWTLAPMWATAPRILHPALRMT